VVNLAMVGISKRRSCVAVVCNSGAFQQDIWLTGSCVEGKLLIREGIST
jgi:hypothetical protein